MINTDESFLIIISKTEPSKSEISSILKYIDHHSNVVKLYEKVILEDLTAKLFFHINRFDFFGKVPKSVYRLFSNNYYYNFYRSNSLKTKANEISKIFFDEKIAHVFLKGIVFDEWLYKKGTVYYGDIDIMINRVDINKVTQLLVKLGFRQGKYRETSKEIIPLQRREVIFSRLNTHEIPSFHKLIDDPFCNVVTIDIQFDFPLAKKFNLDYDIKSYLDKSNKVNKKRPMLPTLSLEQQFIFLCNHLYCDNTIETEIAKGKANRILKWSELHELLLKNHKDINVLNYECLEEAQRKIILYCLSEIKKIYKEDFSYLIGGEPR